MATRNVGGSVRRSASYLGVDTMSALITKLDSGAEASTGTTDAPEIIDIDKNLTIATGATFNIAASDKKYLFDFVDGKRLIFEGTGKVIFHTEGLADPEMKETKRAVFRNTALTYTAGNAQDIQNGYMITARDASVKWATTASAFPKVLNAELWDFSDATKNASMNERIAMADSAVPEDTSLAAWGVRNRRPLKIIVDNAARKINTSVRYVIFSSNRHLEFHAGDYENVTTGTWGGDLDPFVGTWAYPFHFQSDFEVSGVGAVRLYGNLTSQYEDRFFYPANSSYRYRNVKFHDFKLVGNPLLPRTDSGACILVGCAENFELYNLELEGINEFLQLSGTSNYGLTALDGYVHNIRMKNCFTQIFAITNAKNLFCENISLSYRDIPDFPVGGSVNFTPVDLEPFTIEETLDNITIDNLRIEIDTDEPNLHIAYAVALQSAGVSSNRIVINNYQLIDNSSNGVTPIFAFGQNDLTLSNITVQSNTRRTKPIVMYNCEDLKIHKVRERTTAAPHGAGVAFLDIKGCTGTIEDVKCEGYPITVLDEEFGTNATSNGTNILTLPGGYLRKFDFMIGEQVKFNGNLLQIAAIPQNYNLQMTATIPAAPIFTALVSAMTGGDTFNYTNHGLNTGAWISLIGRRANTLEFSPLFVYVVRINANSFKVATTEANALATPAVTFAPDVTERFDFIVAPRMQTRRSKMAYKDVVGDISIITPSQSADQTGLSLARVIENKPSGLPEGETLGAMLANINNLLLNPYVYLLDELSVTLNRAYSFKKLKKNYTGACCRVKPSGGAWGTDDVDIGFDGVNLDVQAIFDVYGENPTNLECLRYDQSGNSNHEGVYLTATAPRIVWDGFATGKHCLAFADRYSSLGNLSGFTSANVFRVVKSVGGGGSFFWFTGTDDHTRYPDTDAMVRDHFGTNVRKAYNPTMTVSDWRLYSVKTAANSWEATLNGEGQHTTASNTVAFPNPSYLFGQQYDAEFLLHNAVLSTADTDIVKDHIRQNYGLTIE